MSLAFATPPDVRMREEPDALVAESPRGALSMPGLGPAARAIMRQLGDAPRGEAEIDARIFEEDGEESLSRFYSFLPGLARMRMLRLSAGPADDPLAVLEPISGYFSWQRREVDRAQACRLSRFAYLRAEHGALVLESPRAHALVRLMERAAALIGDLSAGVSADALAARHGVHADHSSAFVNLLCAAGMLLEVDAEGRTAEDSDACLRQWEFHDLLFHARSRVGRHDNPVGGRFRFLGKIPPQPAVKAPPGGTVVPLPRPDLNRVQETDPSLEAVMAGRRSVRVLDGAPPTLAELGEFFYRVARVKSRYSVDDKGEFTARPYPSGGASYELELYPLVESCVGLMPGLYWYDPQAHALSFIRGIDDWTRSMLLDAHVASARLAWPRVLITIAARFQRVSWKYDAMAYATILKNTGVLYATMYQVATAMGLGPCGVGLGDSDKFAAATGLDYYVEGSVGEFMLTRGRGAGNR